jgi:uncharacterized membrane protein YfcA
MSAIRETADEMSEGLLMLTGGLAAGILGGLLGLGGGIVLMPLLRFGVGLPAGQAAGTCVLAVFFTTLGGSYRHYRLGHVHVRLLLPVLGAGALATLLASLVFGHIAARGRWLDLGIGLVFALVAARMLAEGIPGVSRTRPEGPVEAGVQGSPAAKVGIGAVAGVLPGLLGIGSGGILVPAFVFLLKAPLKAAIGASLLCFCVYAAISAGFKLGQGYIDPGVALPTCVGTVVGANVGALVNRRIPSGTLKFTFGLVFVYVALKFILLFFEVVI